MCGWGPKRNQCGREACWWYSGVLNMSIVLSCLGKHPGGGSVPAAIGVAGGALRGPPRGGRGQVLHATRYTHRFIASFFPATAAAGGGFFASGGRSSSSSSSSLYTPLSSLYTPLSSASL